MLSGPALHLGHGGLGSEGLGSFGRGSNAPSAALLLARLLREMATPSEGCVSSLGGMSAAVLSICTPVTSIAMLPTALRMSWSPIVMGEDGETPAARNTEHKFFLLVDGRKKALARAYAARKFGYADKSREYQL